MGKDGIYTEKDIISICEDFLDRKYELKEKGAIEGIELDYHYCLESILLTIRILHLYVHDNLILYLQ